MRARLAPVFRTVPPALLGLLWLTLVPPAVHAGVVAGFREDWPGTSVQGWGGGAPCATVYSNPGTGGADGVGDGFLLVTQPTACRVGARSLGSEYMGDWIAAGIQRIRVALNDVGTGDSFEIHVAIGNSSNLWQYNPGFVPPSDAWQDFDVDLTTPGSFTQIIGPGTFVQALQNVDRLLIRHDVAPFGQAPNTKSGDLGIDRLILVGVPTALQASTWGRLKILYR